MGYVGIGAHEFIEIKIFKNLEQAARFALFPSSLQVRD